MSKIVEIEDAIHALDIYLLSFYGGFEKISDSFFEGYEQYLFKGKEKRIKRPHIK